MFDIGPEKLVLLAFLAMVLLGPERLPQIARDAGRLLRTLREMATGARTLIRDEVGPELADLDLRSLNPRTMITKAVLGEDVASAAFGGKGALQRALFGGEADGADDSPTATGGRAGEPAVTPPDVPSARPEPRPLGRAEVAPFDADAT